MRVKVDHDFVLDCARHSNWTAEEIATVIGCHPGYARLIIKGRIKRKSRDGRPAFSRETTRSLQGRGSHAMPAIDHPAIVSARTLYPSTVRHAHPDHAILKSGMNSSKIGARIIKGRWNGFPIYTLTLEERATCPASCNHWRSCYGNGMQRAQRFVVDEAFEQQLQKEIAILSISHRRGFAVRLHVLGDFYSVEYVKLWADLLDRHPQLHIFGFTARWDARRDPIALALIELAAKDWRRFAIRFSNAPIDECATISIEYPGNKPDDAIICPQQIGKTECCGTCALCWQSKRRIAFIQH